MSHTSSAGSSRLTITPTSTTSMSSAPMRIQNPARGAVIAAGVGGGAGVAVVDASAGFTDAVSGAAVATAATGAAVATAAARFAERCRIESRIVYATTPSPTIPSSL